MSDVRHESASAGDDSGSPPESAPGFAAEAVEASLTAPMDTSPGAPDARDAQWVAPEPAAGFAAPNPGAFGQSPGSMPAVSLPNAVPDGTEAVPEPPRRRMRGPLIGLVAGAVVVALGVGGYLVVHNLSVSRDNTPVAKSSQAKSGGMTVTGNGITMTFPAGWVNVPTSPAQFQQFVKVFVSEHKEIPAALQAEANDPQLLSSFAMLVFRPAGPGGFPENLDAVVGPVGPAPAELLAELESGQGPARVGATDLHYSLMKFGKYPGVLVTYHITDAGVTEDGAQAYLESSANTVITTVFSRDAATSEADLLQIVDTIRFT